MMLWHGEIKVPMAKIHRAANEGLKDAAEMVLALSDTRVPERTGQLRESGKVSTDPAKMEAAVSYDTAWAVRNHEVMTLKHDDGESKYLENSFNQLRPVLSRHIAETIRRRVT